MKYLSQSTSIKNKVQSSLVMKNEKSKSPDKRENQTQKIVGLGHQNSAQILTKNEKDAI